MPQRVTVTPPSAPKGAECPCCGGHALEVSPHCYVTILGVYLLSLVVGYKEH